MSSVLSKMFLLTALSLVMTCAVFGQGYLLTKEVTISKSEGTIIELLKTIESASGIALSYSSSKFDDEKILSIDKPQASVEDHLNTVFKDYEIQLLPKEEKILIVVLNKRKEELLTISGYIYDEKSGETLSGAIIYDLENGSSSFSNEFGYYSISVPKKKNNLKVSYLGYEELTISNIKQNNTKKDISLKFNNNISPIVISDKYEDNVNINTGAEKIRIDAMKSFSGITGENDVLEKTKYHAGVQSGQEGQGGLYVRGGSPDQNLILMDGVQMYEVSHTAGISSIFIDESVRSAELIKNGYPARYGGRLSSVLNVQLKDGNSQEYENAIGLGLTGGKYHIEGPIVKGKTSFNFSGRTSWFKLILDPFKSKLQNYEDVSLDYHDITGKITHRFSPTSKLSLSMYKGGDDLALKKFETFNQGKFRVTDENYLNWGSGMLSLNWNVVLGSKLFLNANASYLDYDYTTRGSYKFEAWRDPDFIKDELDVITFSNITDKSSSVDVDYYLNDNHRLKAGFGYTNHRYNPTVKQSEAIVQGQLESIEDSDSTTVAHEMYTYIEDTYTISEWFRVYAGLRLSGFEVRDTFYKKIEPRLNITAILNDKNVLSLSAARTSQNVHLLVNSGLGLPSDLWVPSTDRIQPEEALQLSLGYRYIWKHGVRFSLEAYYKRMKNLLDYSSPIDLYSTILNDENVVPVFNENRDWEDRVETGEGTSKGIELSIIRDEGKLTGWLAYTYSFSDRTFESINDGEPFPYRYDRRNDLSVGLNYRIIDNLDVGVSWVYGTGYAYTLSLESHESAIEGVEILVPGKRNAARVPAYHHLDLHLNYNKQMKDGKAFNFNFGVYNVYNRLNPYFVFLYENPLNQEVKLRKVSIFPFVPHLNLRFSF